MLIYKLQLAALHRLLGYNNIITINFGSYEPPRGKTNNVVFEQI